MSSIQPGTYDITVKKANSLTNKRFGVMLAAGANSLALGTLWDGDANDDGVVNSLDYARLSNAYFKRTEEAGYDPGVDFNEDGRINSQDYAPLAFNYFKRSDVE